MALNNNSESKFQIGSSISFSLLSENPLLTPDDAAPIDGNFPSLTLTIASEQLKEYLFMFSEIINYR